MKKFCYFIIILLFPLTAGSQPAYNNILNSFDTLFVNQNTCLIEMQSLQKKYDISDSVYQPSNKDMSKLIENIFNQWTGLDSLIIKSNELTFPNYTKDHEKISKLGRLIDSAIINYKINQNLLNDIFSSYTKFERNEEFKTRIAEINFLKFTTYKPRYIK